MHRTTAYGAATGGLYKDGNKQVGDPATRVIAKSMNAIQEELCRAIELMGLALNENNNEQLYAALVKVVTDHVALADPHAQYQKEAEKGVASGYASLDAAARVPNAQMPTDPDFTTIDTTGNATIGGNLIVTGDLTVNGALITLDVDTIAVEDPLIKLARNNAGDILDVGLYGKYRPAGVDLFTGLFRDATDGKWKLFASLQVEPGTTVDTVGAGYAVATLVCSLESASAIITGGSIDGTPVGATTASTGRFTTVITTGAASIGGDLDLAGAALVYKVNGTQVVKARKTGWGSPTGTASRAAFNADDNTNVGAIYAEAEVQAIADRLRDTRQVLKGLIDDLLPAAGHGLIGA